jgi:urease accessory protein
MGDIDGIAAGPATLAGMKAMATVVFAAPDAEARLETARAALGDLATAGASALPGVLVCRLVTPDTQTLRKTLVPLLAALAGRELPRVWHL